MYRVNIFVNPNNVIAEKQRYEILSCKVLAADPNGGTIAAFSDSKGKLTE